MKKVLLFLLIVSSTPIFGQYVPIVKDWAIWRSSGFTLDGTTMHPFRIQHYMNGDTIINGLNYKKLYSTNYDSVMTYFDYSGAIRETNDGIVYFIGANNQMSGCYWFTIFDSTEVMLYDFTLEEGDTFYRPYYKTYYNQDSLFWVQVKDSVLINNEWRTRLGIHNIQSMFDYWVEGIGSMFGIMGSLGQYFECDAILNCYEDSSLFWLRPGITNCLTIGINDEEQGFGNIINTYPNPATDQINFELNGSIANTKLHLVIYNSIGQIVMQKESFLEGNNFSLNTKDLGKGIFFYEFIFEEMNVRYRGKFIKQ